MSEDTPWEVGAWLRPYCRLDAQLPAQPAYDAFLATTGDAVPRQSLLRRFHAPLDDAQRERIAVLGRIKHEHLVPVEELFVIDDRDVLQTWHPHGRWLRDERRGTIDDATLMKIRIILSTVRSTLSFDAGPPCDLVVQGGRIMIDFTLAQDAAGLRGTALADLV
jgi:hypothetical protein